MSDAVSPAAALAVDVPSAISRFLMLVKYDLTLQRRERGTWWLAAAVIVLLFVGAWQGAEHVRAVNQSLADARAFEAGHVTTVKSHAEQYFANRDTPENKAKPSWRNPADIRGYAFREHVGYAVKPLLPGAGLAVAQGDVLPHVVRVKAESMDSVNTAQEIEHPARLAAGRFDLLFVVLLLWPLVLIALCASVVTTDRESGRLKVLQLYGASLNTVLAAGMVGRVAIATLLFIVAGAAASLITGAVAATTSGLSALLEWGAVVALYSAFWALVMALICRVSASPAAASFSAFAAWVTFAVLLPGLLVVGVNTAVPLPARETHILAIRDANDQLAANRVKMLERFYDEHPQLRPIGVDTAKIPAAATRLIRAEEMERLMAPVEAKIVTARHQQQVMFNTLKWLSPVSVAYEQFARLSGNDSRRHAEFLADVRTHQLNLRSFFNTRLLAAGAKPENEACGTCVGGYGFTDIDRMPRYTSLRQL